MTPKQKAKEYIYTISGLHPHYYNDIEKAIDIALEEQLKQSK